MKKLETLGLKNTTSKTQKKNGTLCFHDPVVDCDYLSYSSGYVRRAYTARSYYGHTQRTIYQLNKTTKGIYESKFNDNVYDTTERIMINSEDQRLDRLAHCVVVFRKNKNKIYS